MTKIDLITGFLGSGKTTFLKLYAKHLVEAGENIGILENDYGAVNVDMMLLSELEGDHCELEMVASTNHNDCHKRRFKSKLISMGMLGYDRVIVEPSGIYDIDEFYDVLREDPINRMYEIGNVISIVDVNLEDNLSSQSEYFLASEIATSGIVLLSRTQYSTDSQIESVKSHLLSSLKNAKADRVLPLNIFAKNWFEFDENDFSIIEKCGYCMCSFEKQVSKSSSTYSCVYFLDIPMTSTLIKDKINILMNNSKYGEIFRIKGFFQEKNQWYEVNATKRDISIKPLTLGQQVIIIIGEALNQSEIEAEMHQTGYGAGSI